VPWTDGQCSLAAPRHRRCAPLESARIPSPQNTAAKSPRRPGGNDIIRLPRRGAEDGQENEQGDCGGQQEREARARQPERLGMQAGARGGDPWAAGVVGYRTVPFSG